MLRRDVGSCVCQVCVRVRAVCVFVHAATTEWRLPCAECCRSEAAWPGATKTADHLHRSVCYMSKRESTKESAKKQRNFQRYKQQRNKPPRRISHGYGIAAQYPPDVPTPYDAKEPRRRRPRSRTVAEPRSHTRHISTSLGAHWRLRFFGAPRRPRPRRPRRHGAPAPSAAPAPSTGCSVWSRCFLWKPSFFAASSCETFPKRSETVRLIRLGPRFGLLAAEHAPVMALSMSPAGSAHGQGPVPRESRSSRGLLLFLCVGASGCVLGPNTVSYKSLERWLYLADGINGILLCAIHKFGEEAARVFGVRVRTMRLHATHSTRIARAHRHAVWPFITSSFPHISRRREMVRRSIKASSLAVKKVTVVDAEAAADGRPLEAAPAALAAAAAR